MTADSTPTTDGSHRPRRHRARQRQSPVDPAIFAERLNRIFATIYPPGRGPSVWCRSRPHRHRTQSGPISALPVPTRSGNCTGPSHDTVDTLAKFFGVRPDYFTGEDPDYTDQLDAELHWLDLAHNPTARDLTTTLLALPPDLREELLHANTFGGRRRRITA